MVVDHRRIVRRWQRRWRRRARHRLSRHLGRLHRHSILLFLHGVALSNHQRHHVFRDAQVVEENYRLRRDVVCDRVLLDEGQQRLVADSALGHVHHVGQLRAQLQRTGCRGWGGNLRNRHRLGLPRSGGRRGVKLRKVGRRANGRWGVIVNARAFRRSLASGGQCHGQHQAASHQGMNVCSHDSRRLMP